MQRSFAIQKVPDDNSCLFRAVSYCIDGNWKVADLRDIVASVVATSPKWTAAMLGQDKELYAAWIIEENSWGGAIELAILSEYFDFEFSSVDIQTGRLDTFRSDNATKRGVLLYSGIHYDVLKESPDIYSWSIADSLSLAQGLEIAQTLRATHQYTDIATFRLICDNCGTKLTGEAEAQSHAVEKGHCSFSEWDQ